MASGVTSGVSVTRSGVGGGAPECARGMLGEGIFRSLCCHADCLACGVKGCSQVPNRNSMKMRSWPRYAAGRCCRTGIITMRRSKNHRVGDELCQNEDDVACILPNSSTAGHAATKDEPAAARVVDEPVDVKAARLRRKVLGALALELPACVSRACASAAGAALVDDVEHLLANTFDYEFGEARYFTLVQLPAGAEATTRLLLHSDEFALQLPPSRNASSAAHQRSPLVNLLFARKGHDLDTYGTVLFQLKRFPRRVYGRHVVKQNAECMLVQAPRTVLESHTVSHNLALHLDLQASGGARLWGIGGQWKRASLTEVLLHYDSTHLRGVYAMSARSMQEVVGRDWFPYLKTDAIATRPVLRGDHPGCTELRQNINTWRSSDGQYSNGKCEFDGKLSIARFRGRYYLYARANIKPHGGGRYVQLAIGDRIDGRYGPFAPIRIEGYDPFGSGNIYFAAIKPNPFDGSNRADGKSSGAGGGGGTLIGLFAVNLGSNRTAEDRELGGNSDGRAFIGLSLSCNGLDWSAMIEIAPSTGLHGRTYDHPVDGLLEDDEGSWHVLIHRDVYGISPLSHNSTRIVRRRLKREGMRTLSKRVQARLRGCGH